MNTLTIITESGSTYILTNTFEETTLTRISDHAVIGSGDQERFATTTYAVREWEVLEVPGKGGVGTAKVARFHFVDGTPHLTTSRLSGVFVDGEECLATFGTKPQVEEDSRFTEVEAILRRMVEATPVRLRGMLCSINSIGREDGSGRNFLLVDDLGREFFWNATEYQTPIYVRNVKPVRA